MEKIMNLQMPGSMSSGSGSRSVQRGDLGEGFLKMMQQKQETSGSDSKTEKAEHAGEGCTVQAEGRA